MAYLFFVILLDISLDIFMVDRGYRDSLDFLEGLGFRHLSRRQTEGVANYDDNTFCDNQHSFFRQSDRSNQYLSTLNSYKINKNYYYLSKKTTFKQFRPWLTWK
jgi:hypothetical protein